jgi:peptide/nickel transport system ATP-binding protein
MNMGALLEVRGLKTMLVLEDGSVAAVDDVSFSVAGGETLAIVGESGCGKSMVALSLMRLLPEPPARIVAGEVRLAGRDLLVLPEGEMRRVRGREIAIVFQEPMTCLNPVLTIGEQIAEAVRAHRAVRAREASEEALSLLRVVNMPDAARRYHEYPHRLSGGMRQRAMIAIALAGRPKLLIADEPTTALDVTVQAQILLLLRRLRDEFGMALILITHDLGVVADEAARTVVMYAGRVIEEAPTARLFADPRHPYTRALLSASPRFAGGKRRRDRLPEIRGSVPPLDALARGCAFAPRCDRAIPRCTDERPPLRHVGEGRQAACLLAEPPS